MASATLWRSEFLSASVLVRLYCCFLRQVTFNLDMQLQAKVALSLAVIGRLADQELQKEQEVRL